MIPQIEREQYKGLTIMKNGRLAFDKEKVLLLGLLLSSALPLAARGESAAAAAPESRDRDGLADFLSGHLEEGLFKAGVAALGDILLNILGVAAAAVFHQSSIDAWFPDNRKGIHSVSGKVRRPAR